jgi:hypothetical protein
MMRRFLIIFAVSVLLPLSVYAKSNPPDISGVMVMNDLDAIVVEGVNFAVETPLHVTLGAPGSPGDITADCILEDDTLITCDFPAGLPPAGDYRLMVSTGSGKDKNSNGYDLTIGSVGPIGPPGADGASCSITACTEPGEATLTCDSTSVTVPCIGPYAIGDTGPAGGIVFFVTDGGFHGLEAAPIDQGSREWGCFGTATGANGLVIGTGAQNTVDILAGCSDTGIAAEIADSYSLNGFNDWFLPSKDELNELYLQKGVVGGFANDFYWSSSEVNSVDAWLQDFFFGDQFVFNKVNPLRVRAVRAF